MFNSDIKSITHLIKSFPDNKACIAYLEHVLWNNIPISPFDEDSHVYKFTNGKYMCKSTGKYFNVLKGTMFENTKIPLQYWFVAIWFVTRHKRGISSVQLSLEIDVTQKTAWFMLQRIRACMGVENQSELDGIVEADETFIGGKNKNRHKDKKVANCQGRSFKDKVPVLGMLQRSEKETITRPHKIISGKQVIETVVKKSSVITCRVIDNTQKASVQPIVKEFVKAGSKLISDEWHAYNGLASNYIHHIVNHAKKEYVNLSDSSIYSNGVECAWKILKGAVSGTYNHVSKKHLQLYVDEFAYRFNMRDMIESDKFNWMLFNCGVRTTYKKLVHG